MIRRLIRYDRHMRRVFYDGPALFNYPGRRMVGYRSPNVLMAYWVHAFAVSYFTLPGRVLALLAVVLFVGGLTAMLMPMYYLSFTLISLFVVDYLVGWLRRPRLEVLRLVPSPVPAQSAVPLQYRVRNLSGQPAWDLSVDCAPPPPGVSFPGGRPLVPVLDGQAEERLTATLMVEQRGRYELPLPLVVSSFPFGLCRWGARGPASQALHVYPRYTPLRTMRLPHGFRFQPVGNTPVAGASDAPEFLGCREYRYGDNPRRIHALSSARLGRPIVKEFRDEQFCRVALMLDNFLPGSFAPWARAKETRSFEALLALTCAVADHLTFSQYQVDLFTPGASLSHLEGGGGPRQLQQTLEFVAAVQPNHEDAFHGPSTDHCYQIGQIGAVLLLLLDWDRPRQELADELHRAGVIVKCLVVTEKAVSLATGNDQAAVLAPAEILAGTVREL